MHTSVGERACPRLFNAAHPRCGPNPQARNCYGQRRTTSDAPSHVRNRTAWRSALRHDEGSFLKFRRQQPLTTKVTGRLPACPDGSEQLVADAKVFAGDRRNHVEHSSKQFVPSEKHLSALFRSIAVERKSRSLH